MIHPHTPTLDMPLALAPAPAFTNRPTARPPPRSVRARAASWDALSGYTKSRMRAAKSDDDWKAIEADLPGARFAFEDAATREQNFARANRGARIRARDPLDALCAENPSANECRAFD